VIDHTPVRGFCWRSATAALRGSISRTKIALRDHLPHQLAEALDLVNVRLREAFNRYAYMRPVRSMVPGGRYEDVDIVLFRENIEEPLCEHYIQVGDDPRAAAS
jgi:isocitrate dehydrogenase (NAD+)